MLATAFGTLHCKGLPLPPPDQPVPQGKENSEADVGHNVQNIGETTPIKSSLGGTPWQEAHADPHAWPWVAEDLPSHTIGSEDDDERSRAAVQDAFEHRLQANTGDMVGLWCDYVQWVEQTYPKTEHEVNVLARACYSLTGDPALKDDIRYLRLWVRHAALLPSPDKVFEFLQTEGIGTCHALFYEAAAANLERQHKFQQVEAMYKEGIDLGAQPQHRLQSRFREFQRRMTKRAAREGRDRQKLREHAEVQEAPLLPTPLAATDGGVRQNGSKQTPDLPTSFSQNSSEMEASCRTPGHAVPRWSSSTLQEEEEELPLHDQAFISFLPQEDDLDDVSVEEMQAARILARHARGLAPKAPENESAGLPSNMTQELSSGLRAMLSESRYSRGRSSGGSVFDPFDDPTYTAELAQKEVLELLASDPNYEHARRNSVHLKPLVRVGQRSARGGANVPAGMCGFEIFDEGGIDLG